MSAERPTGVIVAGLDLNTVDANGVSWRFRTIKGWHSGADVNVTQTQRITAPGQFGEQGRRGGKVMSIVGDIEAADRALIGPAIDALNAVLADGSFGELSVTDRTQGERHTQVQLLGPPDVMWMGGPTASYQLQLLAPDSYKYGSSSSAFTGFGVAPVGAGLVFPLFGTPSTLDFGPQGSTGVLAVTNEGTAAASVMFSVDGPTPSGGFEITDTTTGKVIRFLGAVPDGSQLVLDGADGSVVIDGTADRLGDTIVGAWPQVPAGSTREFLFTPLGGTTAAVLTAETSATYW